jgi:hypothetical protein
MHIVHCRALISYIELQSNAHRRYTLVTLSISRACIVEQEIHRDIYLCISVVNNTEQFESIDLEKKRKKKSSIEPDEKYCHMNTTLT